MPDKKNKKQITIAHPYEYIQIIHPTKHFNNIRVSSDGVIGYCELNPWDKYQHLTTPPFLPLPVLGYKSVKYTTHLNRINVWCTDASCTILCVYLCPWYKWTKSLPVVCLYSNYFIVFGMRVDMLDGSCKPWPFENQRSETCYSTRRKRCVFILHAMF